ncbi:MAG: adenylosuccinate lyase, partial [Planctomycetia bacterium]
MSEAMESSGGRVEPAAVYENPLVARYAGRPMAELWGDKRRFETWRRLWIVLAEAEQELGLPIGDEQLAALRAAATSVDAAAAGRYEKKFRHDVMAHVHAYGDDAPAARGIIHLGATSCYVTDNADLMAMRDGLDLVAGRLGAVVRKLAEFARAHRDLPIL